MSFSIRLLPEPISEKNSNADACKGVIEIGEFCEKFIASLSYWKTSDYIRHWQLSLERIVLGARVSCLITSMHDPMSANFILWWPMYREANTVFFQNQILFLADLEYPFDEKTLYRFVGERKTRSEEGQEISEWSISVKELESFLRCEMGQHRSKIDDN